MIPPPVPTARRAACASLGFSLVLLVLASAAHSDTVVLIPVKDNTLYETSLGNLSNGAGSMMFAGRTSDPSDTYRRALVQFPFPASIPAGSTVTGATLQLTCTASASNGPTILYSALSAWGEGGSNANGNFPPDAGAPAAPNDATWTERFYPSIPWTNVGGDIGALDAVLATTTVGNVTISGVNLNSRVQSWLNNPSSNFGWFILGDESTTGTVNTFSTKESGSLPRLTVIYNPPVTPTRAPTWGELKALYR